LNAWQFRNFYRDKKTDARPSQQNLYDNSELPEQTIDYKTVADVRYDEEYEEKTGYEDPSIYVYRQGKLINGDENEVLHVEERTDFEEEMNINLPDEEPNYYTQLT